MGRDLAVRPLASWNAFTLRLDRDVLLLFALRLLRRQAPQVEDLALEGEGERLRLKSRVRVAGVAVGIAVEVEEIRVKGGLLGFHMRAIKGPLGLGVPRFLFDLLSRRLPLPVELDRESGVVLVDLRGRLPLGLEVEVRHVHLNAGTIEIALGPGRLAPPTPPEVEDLETPESALGV